MSTDTASNYVFYKPSYYYNQLKKNLQLIQQHARDQSTYSHMNNKKYYDKNRSNPRYEINEKNLLRIHGLGSKLDPQFTLIPRIVIQKQHPTYWVRDQMNDQITRVHVLCRFIRLHLAKRQKIPIVIQVVNLKIVIVVMFVWKNKNNHYQRNYRPFIIPSSFYNIVHVYRFTTIDAISTLINHFESCYRYSIDTDSDRFTNELSLVQVHSIPQHLPSFIVLFELNHLPSSNTLLFEKINLLFRFLFRLRQYYFFLGIDKHRITICYSYEFIWMTLVGVID
ncbi:unnamed protein product [Rotaria magnacalcarata]|uniref:Uncharacterized protein n=1 Tax=Rotaria magnacalcarata TaxID=392030 RepID=A0A820GCT4_9BILA|nr:unnamed protein product [Rotaria magnacalcarata]